ncbi:MAG: 4-hydroxy-tetrahydrodipicolinate reductase [Clostridia bacterium]|nr:4-hydroxy-tetrahydrodipicolinate reductase [Clostridia bacterium]MDE7329367.1 4-hydroxy-tetrahydrodipicolinate reductase [Clostridia bacterium]
MIKVLIWGIGGRMGKNILESLSSFDGVEAVGGVDKFADQAAFSVPVFKSGKDVNVKADVIIDFSRPDALEEILEYALSNKVGIMLATTGYSPAQQQAIDEASKKIAVFQSSNMSLGVNLLIELCRKAADFLGDKFAVEIIEQHHDQKVDSPSGTALSIANAINEQYDNSMQFVYGRHDKNCRRTNKEIGIHAVRGGTIVGKHDVMFIGKDEVITLAHEAQSRGVFAQGAIRAAIYLASKKSGKYNMQDMVADIVNNA